MIEIREQDFYNSTFDHFGYHSEDFGCPDTYCPIMEQLFAQMMGWA